MTRPTKLALRPASVAIVVAATGLSIFAFIHFEAKAAVVFLLVLGWIGGFALARVSW